MRIRKFKKGLSLIDMVVAGLILPIIVFGTLIFRYNSTQVVRNSQRHLDGAELTVFMTNAWKGVRGIETFDPVAVFGDEMKIDVSSAGTIEVPSGYTLLNKYDVVSDEEGYALTMSYRDVDATLRELHSAVSWPLSANRNKTLHLTTFVYRD